ncbi:MAG: hypothetical protein LBI66_04360 [Burkholderiaceae bacterium]|jgi:hypothetical protein|nr:hypothetical protein [Burkholderiaceae bacterium]
MKPLRLRRRAIRPLLCTLLYTAALAIAPVATGAQKGTKPTRGSQQVRVLPQKGGSEENQAERDKRLTRECRGRPNAGACAGYALPTQERRR